MASDPKPGSEGPGKTPIGVPGLDEILLGGVPTTNIILVEGGPGTGKTTLGLQFIARGAEEYGEPGIVVSFELSPEKLLRDASGFGWNLKALEEAGKVHIIYTSPAVILDDIQSPDGVLASEIRRIGARRILIDGLTPLRLYGEHMSGRPFRDSLHIVVESLQRHGVTAMITNELGAESGEAIHRSGDERFVCDTILTLGTKREKRSLRRTIEIVKSRGQDFIGGLHTLRIVAGEGIRVYRRTQSRPKGYEAQPSSNVRRSIGCKGIDELLGGGLYDGSVTLVAGISGTGKTVVGVQFLMEGRAEGEKGLLVTLDEHPLQLMRNAGSLGLDLAGASRAGDIDILYDSPLELELDEHFERIVGAVERLKVRRVVLDSLAAYESASQSESLDFIYALVTYLKNRQITTLINYETPELLGISQISEEMNVSHLVDNIVLLNLVEISTQLRRAISIPKVRGSKNVQRTREFVIAQGGVALLEEEEALHGNIRKVPQLPFSAYTGLLARSPARTSPTLEEYVRTGRPLPDSPELETEN